MENDFEIRRTNKALKKMYDDVSKRFKDVWVLVEDGFAVLGIYTSEEKAKEIREEKINQYKYDSSGFFKIHKVELNKKIDSVWYYE